MKKQILILAFFFIGIFTTNLSAQETAVNKKFIYCEIVGTGKLFSNKVTISLDFGQATGFFANKKLKGKDGKNVVFNSMVDAMNWMGNDGWEFIQAYVVTTSNQNVYHWLLKKDISTLSEDDLQEITSKFKTNGE